MSFQALTNEASDDGAATRSPSRKLAAGRCWSCTNSNPRRKLSTPPSRRGSNGYRGYVEVMGPRPLTAFRVWCFAAALLFFWCGAHDLLPKVFVQNAGWDDLIAGLMAPSFTLTPKSRIRFLALHIVGFADFVVGTALTLFSMVLAWRVSKPYRWRRSYFSASAFRVRAISWRLTCCAAASETRARRHVTPPQRSHAAWPSIGVWALS
jgi:hypothetical protein